MGRARSALELDLDPDVTIGLGLPMQHDDVNGFFPGGSRSAGTSNRTRWRWR